MESRGPEDSKNVKTYQAYFFEGFISYFEDFSRTILLYTDLYSQFYFFGRQYIYIYHHRMGFSISAMLSAQGRAYLHETEGRGEMCTFEGR